jgi:hypothetical protein
MVPSAAAWHKPHKIKNNALQSPAGANKRLKPNRTKTALKKSAAKKNGSVDFIQRSARNVIDRTQSATLMF